MKLDAVDEQFETLAEEYLAKRTMVAESGRILAERMLDARKLRADLEVELRANMTKTDAEKEAKINPSYLSFEMATAEKECERAIWEAEADVLRFRLQNYITQRGCHCE